MKNQYVDAHNINHNEVYDFIFIGLGASNSLIILSLLKRGCLKDKKVAVIEAACKTINDKTYCFWASPNDSIVKDLSPIITHYYKTINVNQSVLQNIELQPYCYIRSIDLYNHTLEASNKAQITIYREAVNKITCENEIYSVHTTFTKYQTKYIFDSRPPTIKLLKKNDIYLHQSFYGLQIKLEKDVFQEHSFEMMNFNVEQNNFTQFVYILPFSSREALVELTRFGAEKIDLNYAKGILDKLIYENYGDYEILTHESGCIPMTTFINQPNKYPHILNTGASANLIKPSSGYAFKNMFAFAQLLTKRIEEGNYSQFNKIYPKYKKRFKFYDKLLLIILLYWPNQGKNVFTRLYKKQSVATIFLFLDEKTSLYQEIKIFASLPIIPFIKALILFLKKENWLRYIYAFLSVIIYFIAASFSSSVALYTSYFILVAGFLVVGIPHGALDYMLVNDKSNSLFQFVLKYLAILALYFILWHYFSLFSLIVFVIYSSFHFGESEIEETGLTVSSFGTFVKAFLMGSSILLFIICAHFEESMNIISSISVISFTDNKNIDFNIYALCIAAISFIYILLQSIISKTYAFLGVIFILLIGIKVPLFFAFGLYFIFQHSYNAWGHLQIGLQLNSASLYKKALPFTLGALFIFVAIVIINSNFILSLDRFYAYVFIFLACISLPHFLLMHLFYKTKIS